MRKQKENEEQVFGKTARKYRIKIKRKRTNIRSESDAARGAKQKR